MKRYLTTSFITVVLMVLTLAASISYTASAQEYENTPIQISKEKVRIGSQICYSHIVLEKQTLFSICKAYNVTAEDIYKYNPGVKENGLKKNSIILIPVVEIPENVQETEKAGQEETEQPEEQTKEEVKTQKVQNTRKKTHTVKWYEDIESIAGRYGITVGELMRANGLTGRKLTRRQKLIIPEPGEYPTEEPTPEVTAEQADTEDVPTDAPSDTLAAGEEVKDAFADFFFPKKEVDVSLLLPLKADGTTGSRQNMDFYSGVLLAVYDMAQEGISTNLSVYDVAGGNLPSDQRLSESDIIIGPVASGDINRTFAASPDINALISPLDPRAEHITYSQKSMIHVPAPHATQYNDLVSWIKQDLQPEDRVLFITEKGATRTDAVVNMTVAIDSAGIDYKPLSYSILEGRNVTETLAYLMTETAANRVYIASESEAFVNDVVRNLNVMIHQKYNVVLYAPSKIRSFDTIEVENFHNTKMRVSTGYYIDYNDPRVKSFLLRYRALFNTEPTQFAYQGYDVAKYFIGLCSKYGNRWMNKLEKEDASMLQSTFDFTQTPTGGYINNAVRRIIYDENWKVIKVR